MEGVTCKIRNTLKCQPSSFSYYLPDSSWPYSKLFKKTLAFFNVSSKQKIPKSNYNFFSLFIVACLGFAHFWGQNVVCQIGGQLIRKKYFQPAISANYVFQLQYQRGEKRD